MNPIQIPAQDRFPLAASHFPAGRAAKGVVLISPATGVKRSLYRRFAEYLAGRGFSAITWDWRGTGESRPASLRGFQATMRDWAERDLTGVVDWAAEQHPGLPILTVGHSFGGQALGLSPARDRIHAAVTVARGGAAVGGGRALAGAAGTGTSPTLNRGSGGSPGALSPPLTQGLHSPMANPETGRLLYLFELAGVAVAAASGAPAAAVGALLVLALRLAAIVFDLRLPVYRLEHPEGP